MSDTVTASATYLRRMGGFSSTLLVVGGVIGAGIFLNPAVVAAHTHSGPSCCWPGCWAVC